MAYNELIKNFNNIREYMRDFYVYGFKHRDEYKQKSARSYDNHRRRIESWLGSYTQFQQTPNGKSLYISVDSRFIRRNPLYRAWKAKSFTDGDIILHFIIMDILADRKEYTLSEIIQKTDEYLSVFDEPRQFDESTVRKRLKEYVNEGIVSVRKIGKIVKYSSSAEQVILHSDVLDYFSEVAPCGVIGSFLLDKTEPHESYFIFKHHYITSAPDSEILMQIFESMHEKKYVHLKVTGRNCRERIQKNIVPLRVLISVQSGRQYLLASSPAGNTVVFRLDNIIELTQGSVCNEFDVIRQKVKNEEKYMWGVSTRGSSNSDKTEHVEFTVKYNKAETHIPKRLEREKRCGVVEDLGNGLCKFSADVRDSNELVPWIRTFIGKIKEIHFSDKQLEKQFRQDLNRMYSMYGLDGGNDAAV